MSIEENKTIVRRSTEEFWNAGNLATADELFAADFVDHNPGPGRTPDREGLKQSTTELHTGFSGLQFTQEDLIAEGNKISVRWTFRGTHTGEFAGVSATGKEITMTGMSILRIEGGKIVERWTNMDELGFLMQLGVIPPIGQSGE